MLGGLFLEVKKNHESGSDRIAEAVSNIEGEVFLNIQGDEPFVNSKALALLLKVFETDPNIKAGSLMQILTNPKQIKDPNYVKVTVDKNNNALFFSRSVIPYQRQISPNFTYFEHIGVYAYTKETLLAFTQLAPTPLELAEQIECLRLLENGIPIRMIISDYMGIEIDTPEDLKLANKYFN